jgi:hypothetical protein
MTYKLKRLPKSTLTNSLDSILSNFLELNDLPTLQILFPVSPSSPFDLHDHDTIKRTKGKLETYNMLNCFSTTSSNNITYSGISFVMSTDVGIGVGVGVGVGVGKIRA